MKLREQITPWEKRGLSERREEFAAQIATCNVRKSLMDWTKAYTHLAHDLVMEFGEEEVLDSLEKCWWDLEYEAGLTLREDFNDDPYVALEKMHHLWSDGSQDPTGIIYGGEKEEDRWDLISFNCFHKQVALELDDIGGRKIGISWCMADMAATHGWSSRLEMDFPNYMLRGDCFCWQIRYVDENALKKSKEWSKELSEKYGWRSIKILEEQEGK